MTFCNGPADIIAKGKDGWGLKYSGDFHLNKAILMQCIIFRKSSTPALLEKIRQEKATHITIKGSRHDALQAIFHCPYKGSLFRYHQESHLYLVLDSYFLSFELASNWSSQICPTKSSIFSALDTLLRQSSIHPSLQEQVPTCTGWE